MPCNQNCEQGRKCDCGDKNVDRTTVVVATLLLVCIVSMCFGFYKLINGNTGQDCAVEVRFQDSTATYIGKTV
jgi:hypothetical protein